MIKIVSIYQSSLIDANALVNRYDLGDRFVQFVYDRMTKGYWVVLRLTKHDLNMLIEAETNNVPKRPRLSVIS